MGQINVAEEHLQPDQVPGVVRTIKCEKQVSHLPIALVEELEVVDFYRVDEHEDEAGMLNEIKPQGGGLAQETSAHLVLKFHIIVDDGKS